MFSGHKPHKTAAWALVLVYKAPTGRIYSMSTEHHLCAAQCWQQGHGREKQSRLAPGHQEERLPSDSAAREEDQLQH